MLASWFSPKDSKENSTFKKTINHKVLGSDIQLKPNADQEEVLFGCGCFWGAEKGFWKLPGVITTSVGYAGGQKDNPSYSQVCSGKTGHAEVVRVIWNKEVIDFSDLLKLFWECHDPTQGNRQGNDRGSQYRSAIFTFTSQQLELSIKSLESYQLSLAEQGYGSITTEIDINKKFYIAEEYHQQYLAKPGSRPYCSAMPTRISLRDFKGCNFKLNDKVWSHYDWDEKHCVLRSDNAPINPT